MTSPRRRLRRPAAPEPLGLIAAALGRRDEVPNQELAESLAARRDHAGIARIVSGLEDPDRGIQHDCIKVLYEIGYRAPELVAPYAETFIGLLGSKQNRLVWGGMIALATVAPLAAAAVFARRATVLEAMARGSVITVDNAVKTLARVAAAKPAYRKALVPALLDHLATCRPKEVPQHAESSVPAIGPAERAAFSGVLQRRLPDLSASQAARIRRVLRALHG